MPKVDENEKAYKWGPSEWFGLDVTALTDAERLEVAKDALAGKEMEIPRPCPYLTNLTARNVNCSKPGGVCSVQRYSNAPAGIKLEGHRVAICPSRLVTREVLAKVAKAVLGIEEAVTLVKEVPYSLNMTKTKASGEPAWAGRIDWLLVDGKNPTKFTAVETQSVYMSGKSQDGTFQAFINAEGRMAIPPEYRHPDYKSSVPKRLAPQLESKARHLSSTNRKTVVIVDEYVRSNMSNLVETHVPFAYADDAVRAQRHKFEGSQVIFVIVSLENGDLTISEMLYTSIDAARAALDAVGPMSPLEFEKVVLDLVQPVNAKGHPKAPRADKVFKLS